MKIGIDLDETFWRFMNPFLSFYNKKFNKDLRVENIKEYSLENFFNIDSENLCNLFEEFFNFPLSDNLMPLEGALDFFREYKRKHKFYFITMRNSIYRDLTERNLSLYFKDNFPIYFLNDEKNNLIYTKGEFGKRVGIDLMIDDSFKNLKDCYTQGIKGFLFTQPWNKGINLNNGILRVNNWKEISDFVGGFK